MDFRYVCSSQTMRIYAESFIELETISIIKTKGLLNKNRQFFGNSLVPCLCVLEETLKAVSRRQTGGRYLATAELPDSGTIKSKVLQTESVQWNHRRRFGRRDIVLPNLWSIHGSQKSWGLLFRGLANSRPFLFSAHANWTWCDFNFILFSHHKSSNHHQFRS